ncbi:MAG: hypothetical protein H0W30_15690 [Gemmatimonadaceae bacterium]|nr:hypothetical protein [Gemmatimonadaceae bacterium]
MPSSQGSFVITYLNTNAVLESPAVHAEPTAVGELDFVEGDVVRTRLLLTSSDKNLIGLPTPTVSLVASDGRVGREGISIAKDQTAFVRLVWEDGPTVDIPIRGKSFDISGAKLPAVVKARIVR